MHGKLKRGISPLIATVLIIGFAIALSGIMMTWGTSFVKDIQERSEKSSLKNIACTKDVGLNIKSATVLGNKIKLVIENLGQMEIDKLNILLVGSDGGDNIETGTGISAGGIQSFSVALDPNKIGVFKQVEAMPSVTFEGEQIACKDAVDKEENLAIDTDGLIAYYKLDGDVKDSAGNNNGNILGNPATVSGVFGNAFDFDGIDDEIDITGFTPSLTNDFSIFVWFKKQDPFTNGGISGATGGNRRFTLRFGSINSVTKYGIVDTNIGALASDIQWHHVLLIFSSTDGILLYQDEQLLGSHPNTVNLQGAVDRIRLGRTLDSTPSFLNGTIDEVMIYNKAKTY